jgi:hypothetical protein
LKPHYSQCLPQCFTACKTFLMDYFEYIKINYIVGAPQYSKQPTLRWKGWWKWEKIMLIPA